MKEIQFPKDFSNIVTKLLSEPGDFSKDKPPKSQKPDYTLNIEFLKNISKRADSETDPKKKQAIYNEIKSSGIKNIIPGMNFFGKNSFTGDITKSHVDSAITSFTKSMNPSTQDKINEKRLEREGLRYDIDNDAARKTIQNNRPKIQKLADWIDDTDKSNGGKGRARDSNNRPLETDLDYVSKNLGKAVTTTTENFKEQLPQLRRAGKNVVDSLLNVRSKQADKFRDEAKILKEKNWANSDEYTEYLNSGANTTQANDWLNNKKAWAEKKAEKLEKKAARREGRARSKAIGSAISKISNAIDLGLDTISSRHRQQTIAEGGQAALMRKKARFAQMMGDDSFMTRVAAGNWGGSASGWNEGYGIRGALGRLGSKIVDTINPVSGRIRSTKKNYQRQLQYMDSLRGYDYSEQEEQPQVEPLSWQPEEYDKLNFILNREYEENQNFSEQQTGEQDLGFYDASKLVDITSLTPEKAEALLSKSFYKVSDEEKRYQESIAKGFSEEYRQQKTYENFLNECSEIYDSTSWR